MADAKISALPSATTPLAGTEKAVIVQGGVTKQVDVAELGATLPIDLTTDVTGTLPVANGGTGVTTSTGTGAVVLNTSPTFLTDVSYGASPSTFGEVKFSNGWFIWSRDSGNASNVPIVGLDTDDVIRIGATTGTGAGGFPIEIDAGAADSVTAKAQELLLYGNVVQFGRYSGGGADGGSGIGVIGIDNANTNPSTNPTAGIVLYVDAADNTLKYRQAAGTIVTLDGGGGTSFADDVFEITDNLDATKKFALQCSGITTATTRTWTVPDASSTFVGTDATQTLTNKTISFGSNTVSFTSAQAATACSDETGSGSLVFATSPTLVTPVLGAATATSVAASSFFSTGAAPATTEAIRLTDGDGCVWYGAGTTNRYVFDTSGGELYLGTSSAYTTQASFLRCYTDNGGIFGEDSTNYWGWGTSAVGPNLVGFQKPIGGMSSTALAFNLATITVTGDFTASNSQYQCPILILNGTPAGAFAVTLPNSSGEFHVVKNNTGQTATLKKSGGTGCTVATGTTKIIYHDGSDYVAI